MRYILDDLGFIETISFNNEITCNEKNCTEYTGTIPDGYTSLAEWSENANIRAYKLEEGNLVFDSFRNDELNYEWGKDGTEWTTATLNSAFKVYGSDTAVAPEYRKTGKVVEIRGQVQPTTAIASGGTATIFTLPEGYRPSKSVFAICQGSGRSIWLLTIEISGSVTMSRYGTNANAQCPTNAWLPFNATFTVD